VLYFSKIRIFLIIIIITFFSLFALLNFINFNNEKLNKQINLGLDLQGGSYLLLEIDNDPVILKTLQSKLIDFRKFFKERKIIVRNFSIKNKKIEFYVNKSDVERVKDLLDDDNSEINPYFIKFKSHTYNFSNTNNIFLLELSDYGLVLLKNSSLDQAIEIVRRRVDEIGTNEPNILKRGNSRILVELPGLDDPSRIKSLLGKTANLSFQFVTTGDEKTFGVEKLFSEDDNKPLNVSRRIIISGENLVDAQPRMDTQSNQTVVTFQLDRVGSKKFAKATKSNIGKRLAIVLDGKIISAPTIQDAIVAGSGQITGNFNFQSATDLALLLRSGSLPAPLNIIEERTVGPDLGQDSINAGIISLIIGFILVNLFMIYKYKVFGLIANLTLIINLIFILGILTIFEATLTLPGIAGIILTVGMAVDANVLIFERIKEELKIEKKNVLAFDSGYVKSRTSILDANITTLIAALILFFMGSGPVKGFSVTLGVGIITTLFTVYFIARLLTATYVLRNKDKENLIK
tara:strand:+ start:5400 stop:6956 length:1557 start_codon:yes stop_codon:yes gene_type:complete